MLVIKKTERNRMKVTEQDKINISKTILWLNEAVEWIDNMGGADIDGEPKWNENVKDSVDVACEWLQRIVDERSKDV